MRLPRWWNTAAWCAWAAEGAILEGIALRQKRRGDTLSEHIWALVRLPPVWWTVLGLMIWATLHFLGRGKYG